MSGLIQIEHQAGVATLWLNRPDKHNAFDEHLIAAITDALRALAGDDTVRAVVLAGRGRSFSAGGDLDWMRRAAGYGYEQNLADAMGLATMLRTLAEFPKPTIARVHGAAAHRRRHRVARAFSVHSCPSLRLQLASIHRVPFTRPIRRSGNEVS